MAIIECVHPPQYQAQKSKWIPMDERNSHNQDDGSLVYTWRTINKSFGRPKHLFSLEVQKAICEK
jgi:hypothetical protein